MDKHNVVYTYNGISVSLKEETLTPATTRMKLEDIMLSEINQIQISYGSTYRWYIKQSKFIETESRKVAARG